MEKEIKKQYNFRVEPSLMEKVEKKAAKSGDSISIIIRQLLRNYIKNGLHPKA